MATEVEKQEHGRRLIVAMAAKPVANEALADLLKVDKKTISNWRNGRTMPSAEQLINLEKILGRYNTPGDPVEVAVRGSGLAEWRQDAVLSFYKRNLHEQRLEDVS